MHPVRHKKYQNSILHSDNVLSNTLHDVKLLSNDEKDLNIFSIKETNSVFNYPVHRINPVYPDRAKWLKIEGEVVVLYNVNVIGKVENIRILHSVPPKIFDNSVCLAMSRWVYEKQNPKNDLRVVFKFNLRGR